MNVETNVRNIHSVVTAPKVGDSVYCDFDDKTTKRTVRKVTLDRVVSTSEHTGGIPYRGKLLESEWSCTRKQWADFVRGRTTSKVEASL